MKTFSKLTMIALVGLFTFTARADALIFMDFEPPIFSRDNTIGDHAHTFASALGDVDFNGRILNGLNGKNFADHTTGTKQGSFLKNTWAQPTVDIFLPVDVFQVQLYHFTRSDANIRLEFFNGANATLGSFTFSGNEQWTLFDEDFSLDPVRRVQMTSTLKSNNKLTGNRSALDDISFITERNGQPAIPEPGTWVMVGLGLAGMARRWRTKS